MFAFCETIVYSGGNVCVLWSNCLFRWKCLRSVKQLFMSSEEFWVKIVLFDILLRMSSKLVFFNNSVQEGPLHIPKDIILFQYNLKKSLSAVYHNSCLSVDFLHWYDDGDWWWSGRSNQSRFLHIFLSRKCLLLLLLHLTYLFLELCLILLPWFYQF